jgi:hypothetical protein
MAPAPRQCSSARSHKLLAVLGAGVIGLPVVGIAFAAWTSSGTGSATAQATTAVDSVIAAATSAANLYPAPPTA